jgi:hypothetical protein
LKVLTSSFCVLLFECCFSDAFLQDHQFLVYRPPLPEEGPIQADPAFAASEAPEADEGQDRDDAINSREDSISTLSPPPANSEEKSLEKKRKRLADLTSSSTSIPKDAPGEPATAKSSNIEMFDALDS